MKLKWAILALFFCGVLLGCSDKKESSTDLIQGQEGTAAVEQNTPDAQLASVPEKKLESEPRRLNLRKGLWETKIEKFCESRGSKRCADSLNAIVEQKMDSLKQKEEVREHIGDVARKNDSLEKNGLLSSQPRLPNPEGIYRLLITQKLLEEK